MRPDLDAETAFRRLCRQRHVVFLDSVLRHPQLGRYSFVGADPFDFFSLPADGSDGLAALAARMQQWQTAPVPGLPPFQGGAAGLFSYDLNRSLERIAKPRYDEFQVPAMAIGFYDVVIATDHLEGRTLDHLARIPRTGYPAAAGPGRATPVPVLAVAPGP